MNEKEKNFREETVENDTVSGDNEAIEGAEQALNEGEMLAEPSETQNSPKKARAPMSKRTKKRLITVAIVVGVLLLVLAAVLITVSIINDLPPDFEQVRGRFEELLTSSQEVNEIIWGAGLPTYGRMARETKSHPITFKGKDKSILYYVFEDEQYGTVVAYQYQIWINDGTTNADGIPLLTYYDVESGEVIAKPENGATRFVQKTKTAMEGARLVCEKDGYYYYALSNYQNIDLVYAYLYEEKNEDEHYDFVHLNSPYKSTDDVKAKIDAVYASVFMMPIYEYLFTGVVGATNDVNQPAYLDYVDEKDVMYLMKSNTKASGWQWRAPLPAVEFDLSSMQMTDGNAKNVTVTVNYRISGSAEVKQMQVDFTLEEDVWLLNSPTFG